jgi:hypothetical protein
MRRRACLALQVINHALDVMQLHGRRPVRHESADVNELFGVEDRREPEPIGEADDDTALMP